MEISTIIEIVITALCVLGYALYIYFKVRGNVVEAVSELIALAEKTGLTGPEKMAQVVGGLYDKVPLPLRRILTKEALQAIAQHIFDWTRKYAEAYIEVKNGKNDAIKTTNDDVAEDVTKILFNLGYDGLKSFAASLGIEVGEKSEAELVKEIVVRLMEAL